MSDDDQDDEPEPEAQRFGNSELGQMLGCAVIIIACGIALAIWGYATK